MPGSPGSSLAQARPDAGRRPGACNGRRAVFARSAMILFGKEQDNLGARQRSWICGEMFLERVSKTKQPLALARRAQERRPQRRGCQVG